MDEPDPVAAWQETYERTATLLAGLSPDEVAVRVPACPDWTVQDLLAHMVGLDADVVAGDEPDDHNATWTQAQVDARRGRTVQELLTEWRQVSGPLVSWMQENNPRPVGDVTIHEQDVRGAVDRPGGRDGAGLRVVRETIAARVGQAVADAGLPPITLRGEAWVWTSGDGDPEDAETVLAGSDFDLARAVMSRRTADQLRSYVERGDVEPYLDVFAALGPLPTEPLPE